MNEADDFLRVRTRLLDLQRTGLLNPEAFPTYQQTILQIWQESERRRVTLMNHAATLRTQAAAAEAQANAFTSMASILYNVINGYVELEQKRIHELQSKEAAEAAGVVVSASGAINEPVKRSRRKPAKKE